MLKVKSGAKTLAEAVAEYDTDVITRGQKEVEISRKQTDAFHNYDEFLDSPVVKFGIKPTIDINNIGGGQGS